MGEATDQKAVGSRYRVAKKLGEGGMGAVYLAWDGQVERQVALKVLRPEIAGSGEATARFVREARLMAAVRHPHLLELYDITRSGDQLVMSMEYVEGRDLQDRIKRNGSMSAEEVLRLAEELGPALDALHEQGILHRDLKPANVMLRKDSGDALLMDLGLARQGDTTILTQTGVMLGTPLYLPPEVVMGKEWAPSGDRFQLAAILYHALTGRDHVKGRAAGQVLQRIAAGEWAELPELDPPIPPEFGEVVMAALDPDPEARPATGAELAEGMRWALHPDEAPTHELPPIGPPPREGLGPVLAVFLASFLLAGFFMFLRRSESPAATPVPSIATAAPEGQAAIGREPVLATGGYLRVRALRPCRVHWEGREEAASELGSGRADLPVPEGDSLPSELVVRESGAEYRVSVDWDALLLRLVEELEKTWESLSVEEVLKESSPPVGGFPVGHARKTEGFETARRRVRSLQSWVPRLLQDPGLSREGRRRLLAIWLNWSRSAVQEVLIGIDVRPLALSPGLAGAYGRGVPVWREAPHAPLVFRPSIPAGIRMDGSLALETPLRTRFPKGKIYRAAPAASLKWPEAPPEAGDLLCLSLKIEGMEQWTEFRLSSPKGEFRLSFFQPDPIPLDSRNKLEGWVSWYLPTDLAPLPGQTVEIRLGSLLVPQSKRANIQGAQVTWSTR